VTVPLSVASSLPVAHCHGLTDWWCAAFGRVPLDFNLLSETGYDSPRASTAADLKDAKALLDELNA
jgi:hypothetical protein